MVGRKGEAGRDVHRQRETRAYLPYTPNYTPADGTLWQVAGGAVALTAALPIRVPEKVRDLENCLWKYSKIGHFIY